MMTGTPRTFVGTTAFRVEGLTCARCVAAVTTSITAVPGVGAVDVDPTTGMVTVSATGPVDRADVVTALARAGRPFVP